MVSARTPRQAGAVCCIRHVTTFSVATNEYVGNGKEKAEFHSVVAWDRLADICGSYLGKGMTVAIEGRIQTRQWDDDRGACQCLVHPERDTP